MVFNVSRIVPGKSFLINGASYVGAPRSNTAMYITKKIERMLAVLETVKECLVFAEEGITVSPELEERHAFCFSKKPQTEYARFANLFYEEREREETALKCTMMPGGYFLYENVSIGEGALIEPGCVIGPDVRIGTNARLRAGCVVRRATIGDNFIANENAVIGASGFTMAEDEDGDKIRIPTLGRVVIGDNVEIGVNNNVSCGSGGDTVIEDNVKYDALIHTGHDDHIGKNVEITAGVTLSGFVTAGDGAYFGVGSVMRNRIGIGDHAFIGMGSNVTKGVEANTVVAGNPAKPFVKK